MFALLDPEQGCWCLSLPENKGSIAWGHGCGRVPVHCCLYVRVGGVNGGGGFVVGWVYPPGDCTAGGLCNPEVTALCIQMHPGMSLAPPGWWCTQDCTCLDAVYGAVCFTPWSDHLVSVTGCEVLRRSLVHSWLSRPSGASVGQQLVCLVASNGTNRAGGDCYGWGMLAELWLQLGCAAKGGCIRGQHGCVWCRGVQCTLGHVTWLTVAAMKAAAAPRFTSHLAFVGTAAHVRWCWDPARLLRRKTWFCNVSSTSARQLMCWDGRITVCGV
jgi:hypothetical protein